MSNATIILGVTMDDGSYKSMTLVHGQGVKESVETETSKTVCFDEVITEGAEKVSYKLDIDRIIFEKKQEYIDLRDILKRMQHIQGDVEVRETIKYKNEAPFTIVKSFGGAILDGNEFELKPEEKTAHSLSFVCASKDETIE